MEMRKGVNEDRDESEEEQEGGYGNEEAEEVSTLENMGCILDKLEYEVDVIVYLEGLYFVSCKYSDDLRMPILEGDKDDVPTSGINDLKGCQMMGQGDWGNLDDESSGHFGFEVLPH